MKGEERMDIMFPATMEELHHKVKALSRMNFYLWMYIAQEGDFESARMFIHEQIETPTPFEDCLFVSFPTKHDPMYPPEF